MVALSHPSVGFIVYRSISGHKILTADHVLNMQQINPSHHLMSVVYVYPKRLAGSFEGHWLSALHRLASVSVFPRPSALRSDLTFCVLLTTFVLLSFFLLVLLPGLSFFPNSFVVSPKLLQCASWLRCREQCAVSAQRSGNEWLLIWEPIAVAY